MKNMFKNIIFCTMLIFGSSIAYAGLVETQSLQFVKETNGQPSYYTIDVTLEYDGELRLYNVNLTDEGVEVAESTEVLVNGQSLLTPFDIPPGAGIVFPLTANTYTVSVTLNGKKGGGIKLVIFEDKPNINVTTKGWELLTDGTVRRKATNYIWHRNAKTPGLGQAIQPEDYALFSAPISAEQYIENLNAGVYGTDSINGNAGYTDWRLATPEELSSTIDHRASAPAISNKDGNVTYYGFPRQSVGGGAAFNDPLHFCDSGGYREYYIQEGWLDGTCPADYDLNGEGIITNFQNMERGWEYDWKYIKSVRLYDGSVNTYSSSGYVWPIRGNTQ